MRQRDVTNGWDSCRTPPPDGRPSVSPCQDHLGHLKREYYCANFHRRGRERKGGGRVKRERERGVGREKDSGHLL